MPENPFNDAWVRAYLATTGRTLAPGSMVLEETPLAVRQRMPEAEGSPALWRQDIPETLPANTTEAELLAVLRKLAKAESWELYHTYNSEKSEPGWPDTVITDGVSLLIYELKDNRRKPTPEQETWLSLLAHTGKVECGIWRPKDWSYIYARLTRKENAQ